jgi:hypothetical protein
MEEPLNGLVINAESRDVLAFFEELERIKYTRMSQRDAGNSPSARVQPKCGTGALTVGHPSIKSLARVGRRFFELVHHLIEVIARRILHRRELLVGFELLQPQRLADGQHVPVVDVRADRSSESAAHTEHRLWPITH